MTLKITEFYQVVEVEVSDDISMLELSQKIYDIRAAIKNGCPELDNSVCNTLASSVKEEPKASEKQINWCIMLGYDKDKANSLTYAEANKYIREHKKY